MKINAINTVSFGNKQKVLSKAALPIAGAAAGVAADQFVKGLSKPEEATENYIKGYDGDMYENPYDNCCDGLCESKEYNQKYDNMYWYNLFH